MGAFFVFLIMHIIIESPHSGLFQPIPAQFPASMVRHSADYAVHKLVFHPQCTHIFNPISRLIIDVNRAPDDIKPEQLFNMPENFTPNPGQYGQMGLGILYQLPGQNKLPYHVYYNRLQQYYYPYHQKIDQTIQQQMAVHRNMLLLSCHSMQNSTANGVDICLSNRHGQTAPNDFLTKMGEYWQGLGFVVGFNKPFAGGYIIQHHNQIPAIQCEIRRGLYMQNQKLHAGFAQLKKQFALFINHINNMA